MAKLQVGAMDYLAEFVRCMENPGLLVVSLDGRGRPNVMTASWGSIGIYWGRPIFIAPIRRSRYTHGCIKKTGDFTLNVLPRKLADLATFCGTVSGRDHDKFVEANLTSAPSLRVKSPIIEECVLHYECKVVHENAVAPSSLAAEIRRAHYRDLDYHSYFFGEVAAVRVEPGLRRRI
jgi:flavin reductase (DIM6/NTAB) family NADH-FMN oxidoreductase RutF